MKQVFINLPVEDLDKSLHFYTELGFTINPLFTFHDQKCMVWSESIYVMLQSKHFFNTGKKKGLSDTKNYLSSSFTLPVASIDSVNEIVANGLKAGGTEPTPMIDEGFMQVRTIEDFDGHSWGILYLNMEAFKNIKNK